MAMVSSAALGCDHLVHIYDSDDRLLTRVGEFLRSGAGSGGVAIVIASADHRAALRGAIGAEVGALMELDAAETLAAFMVDASPDEARFEEVIGSKVRDAARRGRRVYAYGEMVDLLWRDGNPCGAIELEQLWNDLGSQVPLSLLCGYRKTSVADVGSADHFADMCGLHSQVVAGAPTERDAERSRRFAGSIEDARRARRFATEVLTEWQLDDAIEDCGLVVGELATNAVRHAGSDFTVSLSRTDGDIHIAVGDSSANAPELRSPIASERSGRGLRIVDAIAARWGYRVDDDGKVVWADVAKKAFDR